MALTASPEPRRLSPELLPHRIRSCASPPPSKQPSLEDESDQFQTPTTEESRLNSTPTTCPPPPAKANRAVGCKRKLSELDFFKVEADEIERLFRPRDLAKRVRRRIRETGSSPS